MNNSREIVSLENPSLWSSINHDIRQKFKWKFDFLVLKFLLAGFWEDKENMMENFLRIRGF